jgi:hypothetical protein
MITSDYEAMKFHEVKSGDLIREATQVRQARTIKTSLSNSGSRNLGFTVVLGTMLISWGEKLKNMS